MMRTLYCTALFALTTVAQAAPSCPLAHWDDYGGTQLFRNAGQGAYVFATTHAQVDADGAPNAYHPDDVGLNCKTGTGFKGLDCPANGGYPNGDWWPSAIVPDPKNKKKGYVQPDGEFKGFFVSQTSLRDGARSDLDPAKYVNAAAVPYLVFPGIPSESGHGNAGRPGLCGEPGQRQDVGVHRGGGRALGCEIGEMSIALAQALGGQNPNPRTGAGKPDGKIAYVVFPKSRANPAWPLTNQQIGDRVQDLLKQLPGHGDPQGLRRRREIGAGPAPVLIPRWPTPPARPGCAGSRRSADGRGGSAWRCGSRSGP